VHNFCDGDNVFIQTLISLAPVGARRLLGHIVNHLWCHKPENHIVVVAE